MTKVKVIRKPLFSRSYKRNTIGSWDYAVCSGGYSDVSDTDIFKDIDNRFVSAVPSGAVVYVPKHVKYPRSHLREFLKTIGGRITIKPEDATIAVYDPIWFKTNIKDSRVNYMLVEVYDHIQDKVHNELLVKRDNLNNFDYPYTVESTNIYVGYDKYITNTNLKNVENMHDLMVTNPKIDIIPYDVLHDQVTANNKIDDDQFLSLATAITSDNEMKNAEMYLGVLSRYSLKENLAQIATLLVLMRLRCLPYYNDFRPYLRSTFYHNLLIRYPYRLAKLFGGIFKTIVGPAFYRGYSLTAMYRTGRDAILSTAMAYVHHELLNNDGPSFPKSFVRFQLEHGYKSFVRTDLNNEDVIRNRYANAMLSYLDNIGEDPLGYFTFRLPNGDLIQLSPQKFATELFDVRYFAKNKEFVREVLNEMVSS